MSKRRSAPILIELIRDRSDLRHGQRGNGAGTHAGSGSTATSGRGAPAEPMPLPYKPPASPGEHTAREESGPPKADTEADAPQMNAVRDSGAAIHTSAPSRQANRTQQTSMSAQVLVPATGARRASVTASARSTAPAGTGSAPAGGVMPSGLSRTWRVPVGFVIVYIGITIILLTVAYSTGFHRGQIKADADGFEATRMSQTPDNLFQSDGSGTPITGEGGGANGGYGNQTASQAGLGTAGGSGGQTREAGGNRQAATDRPANQSAASSSLTADTRQSGLNYIIVEQFPADEAVKVAEYLIRSGIDAMVLPANDRSLRRVLVRQGFVGWRSNEEGQQTLDAVRRLGWAWRSRYGGSKDFEQAYVEKFD